MDPANDRFPNPEIAPLADVKLLLAVLQELFWSEDPALRLLPKSVEHPTPNAVLRKEDAGLELSVDVDEEDDPNTFPILGGPREFD